MRINIIDAINFIRIKYIDIRSQIAISGQIYYVVATNALYLSMQRSPDFVRARPICDKLAIPLLLFVPNHSKNSGYLISSAGWNSRFTIYPSAEPSMIKPLLMRKVGLSNLSLMDPSSQQYMSNNLSTDSSDGTLITLDRASVGGWESFTLEASAIRIKSPSLKHMLRSINRLSKELSDEQDSRFHRYRNLGAKSPHQILYQYDYEVLNLCQHLLNDAHVDSLVASALEGNLPRKSRYKHDSDDIWYSDIIPDLLRTISYDRPKLPNLRIVESQLDRLDTEGTDGNSVSLSHKIACKIRSKFSSRKKICLVATARNEGPYLIDWVAYHRSVGFEQIFVYSNDNDDGSDEVLRILAQSGEIVWLQNRVAEGRKAQTKAYGHAFSVLPDILDYEYTAIIDLDEYFVLDIDTFDSVGKFIAFHESIGTDVIHLNWNIMSSSGHLKYTRVPVVDRFDKRLAYDDHHTKCIVRTKKCMHSTPHYPIMHRDINIKHCDASGTEFASGPDLSLSARAIRSPACVNHYFYKSLDEYIAKFTRNRGDYKLVKGDAIGEIPDKFRQNFGWQFLSKDIELDTSARKAAPYRNGYASRLWDLPGMEEAVARAEEWHSNRARAAGLSLRDFELSEDATESTRIGHNYSR